MLEWYVGITAIASLFIGGLLAGWLSGVRGAGSGLFNGITMWGLILIVALAVGIPAIFNVFNLGRVSAITDGTGLTGSGVDTALWASFWTILGGFLASGLGGMIGGAVTIREPLPSTTDRISARGERQKSGTGSPDQGPDRDNQGTPKARLAERAGPSSTSGGQETLATSWSRTSTSAGRRPRTAERYSCRGSWSQQSSVRLYRDSTVLHFDAPQMRSAAYRRGPLPAVPGRLPMRRS